MDVGVVRGATKQTGKEQQVSEEWTQVPRPVSRMKEVTRWSRKRSGEWVTPYIVATQVIKGPDHTQFWMAI